MSEIHTIHDRLFKQAMSDIRVAQDFFDEYLPETVRSLVNLETLTLSPNSYIDENLKAFSSDVLYQVELNNQHTAYFYILCEHQSKVDALMPFRLLNYIVKIWSLHLKQTQEKSLPLIFPMVFYNGKEPYNGCRSLPELIQAPVELVEAILLKPFHLVDTHDIPDEAMRQRKWAGIYTLVMKHVYARDIWPYVQPMIEMLKAIEQEEGAAVYVRHLLHYWLIAAETAKGPKAFIEAVKEGLSIPIGGELMTMAERLVQQGMQQGMQKGIQKGEGALLMRQLEYKFKTIPIYYKQQIEQASQEHLLRWAEKVLSSQALEDVFKV